MKILIAYYSQAGQTKKMAKLLQEKTGGDLYEIVPDRQYNDDMWKAWDEAKAEISRNAYPDLVGELPGLAAYDVVLIGGPVWGFTLANPVVTFMRRMDFAGKKVSAFWTFYDHDEKYDDDMKAAAKGAAYMTGLPLPRAKSSDPAWLASEMDSWLEKVLG